MHYVGFTKRCFQRSSRSSSSLLSRRDCHQYHRLGSAGDASGPRFPLSCPFLRHLRLPCNFNVYDNDWTLNCTSSFFQPLHHPACIFCSPDTPWAYCQDARRVHECTNRSLGRLQTALPKQLLTLSVRCTVFITTSTCQLDYASCRGAIVQPGPLLRSECRSHVGSMRPSRGSARGGGRSSPSIANAPSCCVCVCDVGLREEGSTASGEPRRRWGKTRGSSLEVVALDQEVGGV